MMTAAQDFLTGKGSELFLTYLGMETDLIFTQGVDLPGFASFPLLDTAHERQLLRRYLEDLIRLGREMGAGVILETPTWMANRDRAAPLGYDSKALHDINRQSVAFLAEVRAEQNAPDAVLSVNLGPRADAYAPAEQMTAEEAETYHAEQISALVGTAADVVSGYTLAYPAEATGIVRAARRHAMPVVISFTCETDGRLPTGETLGEAITEVDVGTDSYASFFMINCAHPEHVAHAFEDAPWMDRIRGYVANASRCSHAELDEAEELDDGNPDELGAQLADIRRRFPQINVLGGCCGTDMRHMRKIAELS